MSKPRIPDSIEHAITLILAELGDEVCAKEISKSASLIRKASDPDHDFMLNAQQCLALDKAYLSATGKTPPIVSYFLRELRTPDSQPPKRSITEQVLHMAKELGECSDKILIFTSPESAAGKKLTHNEAVEFLKEIDDVEKAASIAKQLIMPFINNESKGALQ